MSATEAVEEAEPIMILDPEQEELGKTVKMRKYLDFK